MTGVYIHDAIWLSFTGEDFELAQSGNVVYVNDMAFRNLVTEYNLVRGTNYQDVPQQQPTLLDQEEQNV